MYAARFGQSPEAADFDVDDPAALEIERFARVLGRVDALVETDRRLQLRLQSSVVDDVVVGQGLFDHHQVQIVERAKGILQRELKVTEEEAYLTIQRQSRQRRKSMKEVAEAIVLSEDVKRGLGE